MMSRLVETKSSELEARRVYAPAITDLDERAKLVDGEDVFDPVCESRCDVAGIVSESFCSVASFPTAESIL
jgi:hypothetical protein